MAGVLTTTQKQLAIRLHAHGLSLVEIARQIGCTPPMVGLMVREKRFLSGVEDSWAPRAGRLSIDERERILIGVRAKESFRAIASAL
ncbi:helix-turn-helix domain-containing protein, partial [Kineococcus arenarius]